MVNTLRFLCSLFPLFWFGPRAAQPSAFRFFLRCHDSLLCDAL